jgi:hypothetical protein
MSVRCYICDWSPSNNTSLYHPEVEDYPRTQIRNDDNGRPVCGVCQDAVKRMLPKEDTEISKYMLDKDISRLNIFDDSSESELYGDVYDPGTGNFSGSRKQVVRYD